MLLNLSQYEVVLGSSSERRKQILQEVLKVPTVKIIKPDFEENFSKQLSPREYVNKTSREKLTYILKDNQFEKPTIIICCDTMINCNGKILEKPGTKAKQLEMFGQYRKYPQLQVISSLHIAKLESAQTPPIIVGEDVTTNLNFDTHISDEVLQQYVDSEEGLSVAGGFKYQEMGNVLFLSLEGDFFNVVGLPAKATFQLLYKLSTIQADSLPLTTLP